MDTIFFGLSTVLISFSALVVSLNQTRFQRIALEIEEARLQPNIIVQSEYFPETPPEVVLQDPTVLKDHNIKLFGDMSFALNLNVESITTIEYTAVLTETGQKISGFVPLADYFWFCYVKQEPQNLNFANCVGENNREQTRLIMRALHDIENANFVVRELRRKTMLRVRYTSLVGEYYTVYLVDTDHGANRSFTLEDEYNEAVSALRDNYFSVSNDADQVADRVIKKLQNANYSFIK